jgi:hypothetical protein
MATKRTSKAKKGTNSRAKRIPSVKRLKGIRPLLHSMDPTCLTDLAGTVPQTH